VATWARLPGSFSTVTGELGRKALGVILVDVPGHVDPSLGLLVEGLKRLGVDGIDGDTLPGTENADDAIARHRAAIGEANRQIARANP
jgi:hypothetical protein